MTIDFSTERWEQVKQAHRLWWRGELGRPLVYSSRDSGDPGRTKPDYPALSNQNCDDFSLDLDKLMDRFDYELSKTEFMGDSFPQINLNLFGPGITTAFLGARVECAPTTVWFHAPDDRPIADIHFEYDPENKWLRRVKDVCAAAMEKWQGLVQLSMVDLGGILDAISIFRTGIRLPMDLLDCPDEVNRLRRECLDCWHRFFDDINATLQPVNPGYTAWNGLFCEEPYYLLQCDFAYMISTEMFDHFVLPDLAETCRRLSHSFYHLDGNPQIAHLDSILSIPGLDGIQWVPSDQRPDIEWLGLYLRILESGRKLQLAPNIELYRAMLERDPQLLASCNLWIQAPETGLSEEQQLLRSAFDLSL